MRLLLAMPLIVTYDTAFKRKTISILNVHVHSYLNNKNDSYCTC